MLGSMQKSPSGLNIFELFDDELHINKIILDSQKFFIIKKPVDPHKMKGLLVYS